VYVHTQVAQHYYSHYRNDDEAILAFLDSVIHAYYPQREGFGLSYKVNPSLLIDEVIFQVFGRCR
jgi:hypothetical protein